MLNSNEIFIVFASIRWDGVVKNDPTTNKFHVSHSSSSFRFFCPCSVFERDLSVVGTRITQREQQQPTVFSFHVVSVPRVRHLSTSPRIYGWWQWRGRFSLSLCFLFRFYLQLLLESCSPFSRSIIHIVYSFHIHFSWPAIKKSRKDRKRNPRSLSTFFAFRKKLYSSLNNACPRNYQWQPQRWIDDSWW